MDNKLDKMKGSHSDLPNGNPPSYNEFLVREHQIDNRFWNLFNLLARIMGYFWMLAGIYGCTVVTLYLLEPSILPEAFVSFYSAGPKENAVIQAIAFGVATIFGFLFYKSKAL